MTIISYFIDNITNISPVVIPNVIATIALMFNKAYLGNLIFVFGYALMIVYNFSIGNPTQIFYFSLLEVLTIIGIIYYNYKLYIGRSKMSNKDIGTFVNNNSIIDQLSKQQFTNAGLDLRCDLSKEIVVYSKTGTLYIDDKDLDEIVLPSFSRIVVNTSVNIAIPYGYVGLIWDRSGLAAKNGITVLAGCVDCEYTGDVKVVLYNTSYEDYVIHNNDRIAQLLTVPVNLEPYEQVESLDETDRGTQGFGSSGVY